MSQVAYTTNTDFPYPALLGTKTLLACRNWLRTFTYERRKTIRTWDSIRLQWEIAKLDTEIQKRRFNIP